MSEEIWNYWISLLFCLDGRLCLVNHLSLTASRVLLFCATSLGKKRVRKEENTTTTKQSSGGEEGLNDVASATILFFVKMDCRWWLTKPNSAVCISSLFLLIILDSFLYKWNRKCGFFGKGERKNDWKWFEVQSVAISRWRVVFSSVFSDLKTDFAQDRWMGKTVRTVILKQSFF